MNRFGRTLAVLFCLILCLFSTACSGKAQPAAAPAQLASLAQTLEALTEDAGDPLFADPQHPDEDELLNRYGIDCTLLDDWRICFAKDSCFYFILHPADGRENDVKNNIADAIGKLASQLELYEPEQCARVKGHLLTLRGDLLIYIACADNDAASAALG